MSRPYMTILAAVAAGGLLAGAALGQSVPPADATPTRVTMPKNLAGFQLYDKVDKADRKIVRFLYVNKDALAHVKPGEPFPNGMTIVMEDRDIALEAGGAPIKGADGRLQPTARVNAYLVMTKEPMWGETNPYPPEKDNGDWEYGLFKADGSPNPIKLDVCYACHLPQKELDFTFSGAKIHEAAKR